MAPQTQGFLQRFWSEQQQLSICRRDRDALSVRVHSSSWGREVTCVQLPLIHPANVRFLANKMDKLLPFIPKDPDFSRSAALCFTETWVSELIPDSAAQLHRFQLLQADCSKKLTGKTKGDGLCFYINKGWCTDVTMLKKSGSNHLETLFINCLPFYAVVFLICPGHCLHPSAYMCDWSPAAAGWPDNRHRQKVPELTDFCLRGFQQSRPHSQTSKTQAAYHALRATHRHHCYTELKDAYRSVPHAALKNSDHCLVHLSRN